MLAQVVAIMFLKYQNNEVHDKQKPYWVDTRLYHLLKSSMPSTELQVSPHQCRCPRWGRRLLDEPTWPRNPPRTLSSPSSHTPQRPSSRRRSSSEAASLHCGLSRRELLWPRSSVGSWCFKTFFEKIKISSKLRFFKKKLCSDVLFCTKMSKQLTLF